MKFIQQLYLIVILILLVVIVYLGYLIYQGSSNEDIIAYSTKESGTALVSGEKLAYVILKRPKGAFDGYYYYFGAKKSKDTFPFLQKYSPVLDSDRDNFDKIEGLDECGGDSYVITLRVGDTIKYLQFTPYDTKTNEVDDKVLKTCKRGRP
ncbi:hypothetical protein [Leptospira saintgironsiae]|uniref:Uncharacterized protein n=1 Tax=Leptospira saintgironsiae TaxID=2023183 RepID=A0A2M9Y7R4_9LEPT|nr:hypothetical protein [Leptospira saintgironsiae]PJZ47601.1 hypothetical protein CH362_18370 [Leptospira saintgironsiae]